MKLRRILVAVDASPHSLAALEAAATLAGLHRAELRGIFIEDVDLLRLAGLPFARELIYPLALGRQIEVPMMEDRLKEIAESARRSVSECALRTGAHWHFQVRRGPVRRELLDAVGESDLLVLGKASHLEKRPRVRIGSTAASLLIEAPRPVLVMQHGDICRGPAMIVCDGSKSSLELLPGAVEFASLFEGKPLILLLAATREEAVGQKEEIEKALGLHDLRFRRCSPGEKGGLARLAHEEETGVIILVDRPLGFPAEELPEALDKIDCPLLVYR